MVKITPNKLRRLYYRPNVSMRQVALSLGCSPTTVKRYLDLYQFRVKSQYEVRRGRKLSLEQAAKIRPTLKQFKTGQ